MKHAKHIIRALLLIIVIFVFAELSRQFMRPESFGEREYYWAIALQEAMEKPARHADRALCGSAECHADIAETHGEGTHTVIDCQICHALLENHGDRDRDPTVMPIDRSPDLCLRCHERLAARPSTFKQIGFIEHMRELEMPEVREEGLCVECHDPHGPGV